MSCARGCCATQAEHYKSVRLTSGPTPQERKERQLSKDLDGFQRLSRSGERVTRIEGAAALASGAESPVEVQRGHLIKNDRLRREVEQATTSLPSGAA